jgi:hypothetical protein
MLAGGEAVSDNKKTPATLLDELVALDRVQRCEVAEELRKVAKTFAEVPDGQKAGYVLGVLARLLDSA